jgi:hypothetical protein
MPAACGSLMATVTPLLQRFQYRADDPWTTAKSDHHHHILRGDIH